MLVGYLEVTAAFWNTINKVKSAAGFRISTPFPAQLCNFIYSRTISCEWISEIPFIYEAEKNQLEVYNIVAYNAQQFSNLSESLQIWAIYLQYNKQDKNHQILQPLRPQHQLCSFIHSFQLAPMSAYNQSLSLYLLWVPKHRIHSVWWQALLFWVY